MLKVSEALVSSHLQPALYRSMLLVAVLEAPFLKLSRSCRGNRAVFWYQQLVVHIDDQWWHCLQYPNLRKLHMNFYAGFAKKFQSQADLICICIWVSFDTRIKVMCPRNSSLSTLDPTRFHLNGLHQKHCLSVGYYETAVSCVATCYTLMHHYTTFDAS